MRSALLSRRILYVLASLLPVWAIVAFFTGGVGWMLGPFRLSSRQPLRPLLFGLAIAGWYAWKYTRLEREEDGRWLHRAAARVVPFAVPLMALAALYVGVHFGSFAAAGSDSYGYLSQARLWLSGLPRIEQPWVQDFTWKYRDWISSPLGYRPISSDGTIVPTYPAGLPLLMAAFFAVGGDNGPFYIAPLLAGLTVGVTYFIGRDATGSRTVGAIAALLLSVSPAFLTHAMVPMSDVPAAAGWALAVLLTMTQWPLSAGIVSGLTLLIRPNLALLALVPVFAWRRRREPLIRYAMGIAPGVLAIMIVNTLLYGGPLTTGYGSLLESYTFSALPVNVGHYVLWLVQTQTPFMLLAAVPLFARGALRPEDAALSPRACLAAIVGLTFLSYFFYAPFDHWFYLRFLLPAYPALFVLLAAALRWLAWKLPEEARVPLAAAVCAVMIPFGINVARHEGVFNVAAFEQRHIRAANEVAARAPAGAYVLAVQHSGSVRYYANRTTLRWDWIEPGALDTIVRDAAAKGHRVYLVVDDWEEKEFRARFPAAKGTAQLGSPIARVSGSPDVRIFEMPAGGAVPTQ